jgi:zinc transport system substrate-binding protein
MRIVCAIATGLALAALAAGCGSSGDDGGEHVVASFYPLAFAAGRIGGDRVSVENLTPPGAEPHDFELTPKDVAAVQKADLVLYLSHGFQPAVEKAIDGARGKKLDALDGIALHRDGDPHVWLDPVLFAEIAGRVGAELGAPVRAGRLARELAGLDRDYRRGLANCRQRELVTTHAAFGYLASRYRLKQVAITGVEPEAEPGAQSLADLVHRLRRDHVTTVFVEKLVSPRLAETVAREAGATTAVLDPIEGLTKDEAARGDDYFTLMRRNLATLRSALGCR